MQQSCSSTFLSRPNLSNIWNRNQYNSEKKQKNQKHSSTLNHLEIGKQNDNSIKDDIMTTQICSQPVSKIVTQACQEAQIEKIVMPKKQLLQFTKKFAIDKLDLEQRIEKMGLQLMEKNQKIELLNQQVSDLRTQEDYLMRVMEQLRDRHFQQIQSIINSQQNTYKLKDNEILCLKQQVKKIRKWVQEEKQETKRCMGFLKIKDQIIESLQLQVNKLRHEIRIYETYPKQQSSQNLAKTIRLKPASSSGGQKSAREFSLKKIVLRKDRKQDRSKSKPKCSNEDKIVELKAQIDNLNSFLNNLQVQKLQLQNEKFQIYSKYHTAWIQNESLKKQVEDLNKNNHKCEGYRADCINSLDQITRKIQQSHIGKQKILTTKCQFLEKHVAKLKNELNRIKLSESKELQFEVFQNCSEAPNNNNNLNSYSKGNSVKDITFTEL